VDLNLKAFKNQGLNHQLQFRGTIQTDGVGVSIIKKTNDTAYGATVAADTIDVPYITTLRAEEHQEIAGRCVTIDPGRRDLLFCVHENSTPQEPHTFRYTNSYEKKMRKTTKYRRLELAVKEDNPAVQQAERY
jgi:transposase